MKSIALALSASFALGACAEPSIAPRVPIGEAATIVAKDAKPAAPRPARFASIEEAVAFIQTKVDVPVVLPSPLPPNTRLESRPVYRFGLGRHGWALRLRFGEGDGRPMLLQYGLGSFDGCGGSDFADPVDILGQRGLINGERGGPPWAALIWPVTEGSVDGTYGLHGGFSKKQAIAMAESMEAARVEAVAKPPNGC